MGLPEGHPLGLHCPYRVGRAQWNKGVASSVSNVGGGDAMTEYYRVLASEVFIAFAWMWMVAWLVASFVIRRAKGKRLFAPTSEAFLFSEKWASGRSLDTWWSKLGGARNCLFVAVARDKLVIQPHFPFTLGFLAEIYGLERQIPLDRVLKLSKKRSSFQDVLALEYSDELRSPREFELRLRNPDAFLRAVLGRVNIAP
jgi:hypothetical protein